MPDANLIDVAIVNYDDNDDDDNDDDLVESKERRNYKISHSELKAQHRVNVTISSFINRTC